MPETRKIQPAGKSGGRHYEFAVELSVDCCACAHFNEEADSLDLVCKAFPDGIPDEIQSGKVSHREPVEGDRGIQFADKYLLPDETEAES
jgi:hypothetical protein